MYPVGHNVIVRVRQNGLVQHKGARVTGVNGNFRTVRTGHHYHGQEHTVDVKYVRDARCMTDNTWPRIKPRFPIKHLDPLVVSVPQLQAWLDRTPTEMVNAFMFEGRPESLFGYYARVHTYGHLKCFIEHDKSNMHLPVRVQDGHRHIYPTTALVQSRKYGYAGGHVRRALVHGALLCRKDIEVFVQRKHVRILVDFILGKDARRFQIREVGGIRWTSMVEMTYRYSGISRQTFRWILEGTRPGVKALRAAYAGLGGRNGTRCAWVTQRKSHTKGSPCHHWQCQRAFDVRLALYRAALREASFMHVFRTVRETLDTRLDVVRAQHAFAPGGPGYAVAAAEFATAAGAGAGAKRKRDDDDAGPSKKRVSYSHMYKPTTTAEGGSKLTYVK